MYISEIIHYLLWPAMILVSWLVIWFTLTRFEKKFPGEGKQNQDPGSLSESKGDNR